MGFNIDKATGYSNFSKAMHWLIALAVYCLFGLGLWIVSLDYYHPWYVRAPDIHRSAGLLAAVLMAIRLLWLNWVGKPKALASHTTIERVLAHCAHLLMYILFFATVIAGYLMSSTDGHEIIFFNLYSLPSSGDYIANQEDVAGTWHKYLAWLLVITSLLHALAALKHHFIDRDNTLKRML